MTKLIDLTGQRFGRLAVVGRGPSASQTSWRCICDCGQEAVVFGSALKRSKTRSCGCLMRETRERGVRTSHGRRHSPEYASWCSMKQRCLNPKNPAYDRYGGRGITICEEWRSGFEAFLADMGPRPPQHSLDRIDNDGPYCKDNCRWATPAEQNVNTRQNVFLDMGGERVTTAEAARRTGLSKSLIHLRIKQHGIDSPLVLRPTRPSARRSPPAVR